MRSWASIWHDPDADGRDRSTTTLSGHHPALLPTPSHLLRHRRESSGRLYPNPSSLRTSSTARPSSLFLLRSACTRVPPVEQVRQAERQSKHFPAIKTTRTANSMFVQFLRRPALAIVISVLILFLARWRSTRCPSRSSPPSRAQRGGRRLLIRAPAPRSLVTRAESSWSRPSTASRTCATWPPPPPAPARRPSRSSSSRGTDPNVAVVNVNNRIAIPSRTGSPRSWSGRGSSSCRP